MYGMTEEQKFEHKTIFMNIAIDNNRNIGTIIGMSVFGLLGFLSLGFTFVGAIGGGVLGMALGRYVGQKVSKKLATKRVQTTEFDIFVIRIKCLIKWCKLGTLKYRTYLNLQRFTVERLLTEIKPLLHFKCFDKKFRPQCQALINDLLNLLSSPDCLYPLLISYKLTKQYIKIIESQTIYSNFSTSQIQVVLAETIQDVLIPFHSLFLTTKYLLKNKELKVIHSKITTILTNPTVLATLTTIPDIKSTPEYIQEFASKLNQKINVEDLERFLSDHLYLNNSLNRQPSKVSNQSPPRRRSLGDLRSYEEVEQEIYAQQPQQFQIYQKKAVNRAKSMDLQEIQIDLQFNQFEEHKQPQHQPLEVVVESKELRESREAIVIPPKDIRQSSDTPLKQSQEFRLSNELECKFNQLIELIQEPITNWELVLQKEGVVIYRIYKENNPTCFIKGHGDLMGIDKDILFHSIFDEDYRKKWDKILCDFQIIDRESSCVDIMFYYVQSPFGVANREFCQKRIVRHNYPKEGQISLLYFSVDHKNAPKTKGHVRAETLISGYIMENTATGCRLYFCSNNDVKGNIPKSLVNFVASRAPITWINSLRSGCSNYSKIMAQLEKERQKNKK